MRIVVAQSAPLAVDAAAVLRTLGAGANVEIAADPPALIERLSDSSVDLVVLDSGFADLAQLREALPEGGPPLVVVTPPGDEAVAAQAFAAGAADCVAAGPALAELLPEVALEQLRLRLARRERGDQARVIADLKRRVRLSEKLASIGQLAAGIAHEINNPMGFVHANLFQLEEYVRDLRRVWGGVAELLDAAASEKPDAIREAAAALSAVSDELDPGFLLEDLGKAVAESREGSERVRRIVQDLRRFARADPGESESVDLHESLEAALQIAWSRMKHSVVLEKQYATLPAVRCRPLQIQQVLLNLLVNATQAVEARGDSAEPGGVCLRTRHEGEWVVIEVEDGGVGIPPDLVERIFEPFFTTKEVGEGMGLGLATCYAIVERHGGRIELSSREEEGTTFSVRLPVAGA